jgi:WD40 repeat protein
LFDQPTDYPAIGVSPDGKFVAMGLPLALFDLQERKVIRRTPKKETGLSRLTFSADGRRIFGLGWAENTVFEVDPDTMVSRPCIQGVRPAALAVFPNGKRIVADDIQNNGAAMNDVARVNIDIWELGAKKKVRTLTGLSGDFATALAVSADGRRVAAGSANDRFYRVTYHDPDTRVLVWDADNGEQITALPGSVNGHRCVAFAPDERTVAAGGEDHCTYIWELATGAVRAKLKGHEGPVTSLAFTADSRVLYSGSSDTTILSWDLVGSSAGQPISAATWAQLTAPNAMTAHAAMRALISTPDDAVAKLTGKLKKTAAPDEAKIRKLIADLDSEAFGTRETASKELVSIGRASIPFLRRAAQTGSLELSLRANKAIRSLETHPLSGQALFHVRAVEILEQVATPAAKNLLRELAEGARGDLLTEEARGALERLKAR